jgi:hypothetical protein
VRGDIPSAFNILHFWKRFAAHFWEVDRQRGGIPERGPGLAARYLPRPLKIELFAAGRYRSPLGFYHEGAGRKCGCQPPAVTIMLGYGENVMPADAATVNELTEYEIEQVGQIAAWKSKPINPLAELWNLSVLQAAKLMTFAVPPALVRSAIESSYRAAQKLAAPQTIAIQAGVRDLTDLRKKPLEECDRLAQDVANTARALATIEGAVTGVGGPLTSFIDVPLLFISALRTIVRISHCYGYPGDNPSDRYFNLGVLTIATAGSVATRLERLEQLQDLEELLVEETQVDLIRSELLSFLFQLEIFEDVPGVGIASGAVLNLSFMHRVETTARRVFQERWLKDNGKIREIAPEVQPARDIAAAWTGLVGRVAYSVSYHVAFGAALPVFAVEWFARPNVIASDRGAGTGGAATA